MVIFKDKSVEYWLKFAIGLMLVILINQIAAIFPVRLDLTEEKRFSISDATKQLLSNLDDIVFVDVYLYGDLPSGFKRLKRSIQETLDEFGIQSDGKVQYRLVNPDNATGEQARNGFMQYLANNGIQATNVFATEDGRKTQKLIFPGAIISYYGEERGALLLKGNRGATPEEILNQSIENIEYELADAIRTLAQTERKLIGFIRGHNELDSLELAGFTNTILEKYDVFNVNLKNREQNLDGYSALIIAKPTSPFSEIEKYRLDQYIINGGKAMFLVDALSVNMDSAGGEGTIAFPNDVNLRDMLFRYGVRINENLIQDLNSGQYPVIAGNIGDQPQISLLPWPFFPVANMFGEHSIVRNMDAVYAKFVSNIDTVKAEGIQKTPLIYSSQYSRVMSSPVLVSFNEVQQNLDPQLFTDGPQPIAYLLEGRFTSLYKNRITPEGTNIQDFKENGIASKIIVCADGDIVRNEINIQTEQPLDLGFDQFTQTTYANKDFIMNSLEYLIDDNGIINARNKEIQIRPLDKIKIAGERSWWQAFNLLLPVVLLIIFGYIKFYLRRKRFASF
ncbi:MAG: gliding motility-associated ABC transporter substrate-binding protein GldG [Bacteroidetes bacterium]|nr:gliding motility-associated ABC transporter substrate-binding protein GldG [Bacteroidota bacterium]MDA1122464.1 gliding motility-associated ABC transporter substrate-binding protein GldG [Bacteroidota bacterium]